MIFPNAGAFLWSCFLLFGKVMIGSLLWLIAICIVCVIIIAPIIIIKSNLDKKKEKKEKPRNGMTRTWH